MAEAADLEPGRVAVRGLQQRLDRGPHGAPPGAELAADPVHAGVLTPQLSDRPPACPHRQRRPRRRDGRVLLNERGCGAVRVRAHPTTLQPPDPYPPTKRRRADQIHNHPAVGVRDHPARTAAHPLRLGLNRDRQRAAGVTSDLDHPQPVQADQQVTSSAVPATTAAQHRLTHRLGVPPLGEVLKIRRGRSPLIIEGLDTPTWDHAQRAELTPHSVAKSSFTALCAPPMPPWRLRHALWVEADYKGSSPSSRFVPRPLARPRRALAASPTRRKAAAAAADQREASVKDSFAAAATARVVGSAASRGIAPPALSTTAATVPVRA